MMAFPLNEPEGEAIARLASFALTVSLITMPPLATAQRAIPEDNLAYPVLLTIGSTTGSGFYLNAPDSVYLVTAKHVLFDPATHRLIDSHLTLLSYSKDPGDATHNVFVADLSALQTNGDIKPHPSQDVAVIKLFTVKRADDDKSKFVMIPEPGVTASESSNQGVLGADSNIVKLFANVITGNDVMVFGYPVSLGLQQLPELDVHRPLLRKGIVAGTNPDKHAIIIDCPSYFGNSGGPVVELDREPFQTKLYIIGVVVQYVPFVQTGGGQTFALQLASNSGYSIVVPMDFVMELIR
jgi:S1-C subfamily serine protease